MRCRSVCAEVTAPALASASALTWCCSAAVGDGGSNQRSIMASSMGANTTSATAAARASTASNQATGVGRNDSPASGSLLPTAVAAAGARKANTVSPTAKPVTRAS